MKRLFFAAALAGFVTAAASAQQYKLTWSAISGGGGTSTDGTNKIQGSIGQPAADVVSGCGYTVRGGFWGAFAVQTPGAPFLQVEHLPNGGVRVFWPVTTASFVLESTPALSGLPFATVWTQVAQARETNATEISVTINAPSGNQFFRLNNGEDFSIVVTTPKVIYATGEAVTGTVEVHAPPGFQGQLQIGLFFADQPDPPVVLQTRTLNMSGSICRIETFSVMPDREGHFIVAAGIPQGTNTFQASGLTDIGVRSATFPTGVPDAFLQARVDPVDPETVGGQLAFAATNGQPVFLTLGGETFEMRVEEQHLFAPDAEVPLELQGVKTYAGILCTNGASISNTVVSLTVDANAVRGFVSRPEGTNIASSLRDETYIEPVSDYDTNAVPAASLGFAAARVVRAAATRPHLVSKGKHQRPSRAPTREEAVDVIAPAFVPPPQQEHIVAAIPIRIIEHTVDAATTARRYSAVALIHSLIRYEFVSITPRSSTGYSLSVSGLNILSWRSESRAPYLGKSEDDFVRAVRDSSGSASAGRVKLLLTDMGRPSTTKTGGQNAFANVGLQRGSGNLTFQQACFLIGSAIHDLTDMAGEMWDGRPIFHSDYVKISAGTATPGPSLLAGLDKSRATVSCELPGFIVTPSGFRPLTPWQDSVNHRTASQLVLSYSAQPRRYMAEGILRMFHGWSYIESSGNASDTTGFGAVGYSYRIRTREVTNREWLAFLMEVLNVYYYCGTCGIEDLSLFDTRMETDPKGGIRRSPNQQRPFFELKPGMENKPVLFVSWFAIARYANWQCAMEERRYYFDQLVECNYFNGCANGAYSMSGSARIPDNAATLFRNPGARYFIPSENEWYKAAYYNPANGTYSDYPTRNNAAPTWQTPPGGANAANLYPGDAFPANVGLRDAGSYPNTSSWYGLFDMAGNVEEWLEDRYFDWGLRRGGYWGSNPIASRRDVRTGGDSWSSADDIGGFRLGGRSD